MTEPDIVRSARNIATAYFTLIEAISIHMALDLDTAMKAAQSCENGLAEFQFRINANLAMHQTHMSMQ